MGSTFSVGKKAAAVVGPDGAVYYALFEQTYESNVHPRTPHWCAVGFGTAADCMSKIVAWSADCEGGCLKGRGGDISPSAYIKQWREALAAPVEFAAEVVTAAFGGGIYKFGEDDRHAISAILARHGHPGIQNDKMSIEVRRQPELLAELIREKRYAWRYFDIGDARTLTAEWASYAPKASQTEVPQFEVFFVPTERKFEQEHWIRLDGNLEHTGWEYSTIQMLIHKIAIDAERRVPGSAEYAIRKIREIVKDKRQFSMDQRITIDPSRIKEDWRKPQFKHLAGKLALSENAAIETTFRKAREADAEYELCGMPDEAVTFIDLPAAGNPGEQQQLLAA